MQAAFMRRARRFGGRRCGYSLDCASLDRDPCEAGKKGGDGAFTDKRMPCSIKPASDGKAPVRQPRRPSPMGEEGRMEGGGRTCDRASPIRACAEVRTWFRIRRASSSTLMHLH